MIIATIVAVSATVSSIPSAFAVPPNPILWNTRAPMPYPMAQGGVIGGLNGKIYAMGGYTTTSTTPNSTAYTYDPRTNNWSSIANLPTPTRGPSIAVDNSGLIYVISGYTGSVVTTAVQVYNTTSNTWSLGTAIPQYVWMSGATTGIDGRIYVAGGEVGAVASRILQIYNPQTKVWTSGASMSYSRKQFEVVAAPNGLIYAIGGMTNSSVATPTVEAYNITSNTWTPKASLPSAVLVYGATMGPDGLIYVFGGSTSYSNNSAPYFNTVYSYDPSTDTWYTNTQTLPTARREVSAATSNYNNHMYVIGGANGAILPTNEEASLSVGHPTTTTVTCSPATVVVGNSTSCTATVTDTNSTSPTTPTGGVGFSTSGSGTFTGTCTLSGTGPSASCTTSVTYSPTAVGTGRHIISGTYGGDSTHNYSTSTGSQSFTLNVTPRPPRSTTTTVTCAPSSVIIGNVATVCTVTVTDSSSGTGVPPTGEVVLSTSGSGVFAGYCNLSGVSTTATCFVTYTPGGTTSGIDTITASYPGDGSHSSSSNSFSLTVGSSSSPGGSSASSLPTIDWIILAVGVAGGGLILGFLVLQKNKRKQKTPFFPTAPPQPAVQGPPSPK